MDHFTREQISEALQLATGRRLSGSPVQGIFEESGAQRYELGSLIQFDSGGFLHRYRYALIGALPSVAGNLYQAPVPAGDIDLVPTSSFAIGSKDIGLTLGGNAVTLNQYAGGVLYVNDGTGQGQTLRITSHPAALAGATCIFACTDALTIALNVADSLVSLIANSYSGAIIHPSPPTARVIGVAPMVIPAAHYGWVKTKGPIAVLINGTVYIGEGVTPSTAVNGAVMNANQYLRTGATAAGVAENGALAVDSSGAEIDIRLPKSAISTTYDVGTLRKIIGYVLQVNVDTDYGLVDLCID